LFESFFNKKLGTIAFNLQAQKGPWGGSSVFVAQLSDYLKKLGYRVTLSLDGQIDVIILVDPRKDQNNKIFALDEIEKYKLYHRKVKVLHRINECDKRKNTSFMDPLLEKANQLADYTVFISSWLEEYHISKWFDTSKPHSVIYNGADPRIFNPIESQRYIRGNLFKIITHHWSNSWLKGFKEYEALDNMIADGELPGTEFYVMGRYPEEIKWRSAKLIPPKHGKEMAKNLRNCHAYLTASRWEPCGMHHVEGAQCGLPLIYHSEGGGIVEAGTKYGVEFCGDLKTAIEQMRDNWPNYRTKLLENIPSGDLMCFEYAKIIQKLICS